jgi:hypothetical protein
MSGSGYRQRAHRISFSQSLCKHIIRSDKNRTACYLASAKLVLGNRLEPGKESGSGLYAVVKAKSRWPLRVTFHKELAESWRLPGSRDVYECRLDTNSFKIIPRRGW